MAVKAKVIAEIQKLKNFHGTQRSKYRRNLRMYEYSPLLSLDNLTDAQCVGYYQSGYFDVEDDTTSSVQENVIRSAIETLTSKIASQKVRPFFNTVNGEFKEMRVVRQAQQYFDLYFDEVNLGRLITQVFRDACVFEVGYLFLEDKKIYRVMPWQVYTDPREESYSKLTKIAYEQTQFPVSLLPPRIRAKAKKLDSVTRTMFWDLNAGIKATYVPELDFYEEEPYDKEILPFVSFRYTDPIKASSCQSIVDLLYGVQMEIDALMTKIKDASQLSSPLTYFVPESSTIKVDKMSTRTGEIITYTASPNMTGSPVTAVTHPFMDPQWMDTVEKLKEHASEMVGLSQLSQMSKKPAGLNSGVALSTMEDIESDRFETQLNNIIRMYVEVTKACLKIYDAEETILPVDNDRLSLKWQDLIKLSNAMSIQYSAAEMFSKDPSQKLQQINAYYQAGFLSKARANQLMEIPDLQQGYNIMNNSLNAVLEVIDEAIEQENYDIPDYIPRQLLKEEIINTQLSLKATGNPNNAVAIQRLDKLFRVCVEKDVKSMTGAEMAAVGQLNMEMQQDLADPNGQINTAINQATAQAGEAEALTPSYENEIYTV